MLGGDACRALAAGQQQTGSKDGTRRSSPDPRSPADQRHGWPTPTPISRRRCPVRGMEINSLLVTGRSTVTHALLLRSERRRGRPTTCSAFVLVTLALVGGGRRCREAGPVHLRELTTIERQQHRAKHGCGADRSPKEGLLASEGRGGKCHDLASVLAAGSPRRLHLVMTATVYEPRYPHLRLGPVGM